MLSTLYKLLLQTNFNGDFLVFIPLVIKNTKQFFMLLFFNILNFLIYFYCNKLVVRFISIIAA